jgi:arylsulfatase A-like enzyme
MPFAVIPENPRLADDPEVLDETSRRLFVPYGHRVDFHLRIKPGAVFRAEKVSLTGEGRSRLEIRLATDEEGEILLASIDGRREKLEYRLAQDEALAARLSFLAESDAARSDGSGIVLTAPTIWGHPSGNIGTLDSEQSPRAALEPRQTPNIIIYLVDTLRPDHLGAYGYSKPTSPHLDRFAETATLFEYAVGQAPWTRPSVASILTGMTPLAHGTTGRKEKLSDDIPTLSEILGLAGYTTAAIFSNPNVSPNFGFDRGFDDVLKAQASGNDASGQAMTWINGYWDEKPFLLYIHTSEPHQPYLASEPYRERFAPNTDEIVKIIERNPRRQIWKPADETIEQLNALYDAEIAENDAGFGKLLQLINQRELYDSSLIIFVSDHGEEFYEQRRWGHGRAMVFEQLNVALVVKFPGQTEGTRIAEAAQHIDILPTILDLLGLPIPSSIDGRSLAALARDRSTTPLDEPAIFSHNHFGAQHSVLAGDYKLIQRRRRGVTKRKGLYDWRRDPRETSDLLEARPILANVLATLIEREKARFHAVRGEDAPLDDETLDELRALGYLE